MTDPSNIPFSRAAALHNIDAAKELRQQVTALLPPYLFFIAVLTFMQIGLIYASLGTDAEKQSVLLGLFFTFLVPYLGLAAMIVFLPVKRIISYNKEIRGYKKFLANTEDTSPHPIKLHNLHRPDNNGGE